MARTEMPTSIEGLREVVLQQKALIDEQAELITFCREWKRLIDSQRFGSRSEKIPAEQGHLFNEAEILAAEETENESDEVAVPAHTRKKRGRRALPDFLPVQEIVHDLSDAEKVCPHDPNHTLVEIGRESSD